MSDTIWPAEQLHTQYGQHGVCEWSFYLGFTRTKDKIVQTRIIFRRKKMPAFQWLSEIDFCLSLCQLSIDNWLIVREACVNYYKFAFNYTLGYSILYIFEQTLTRRRNFIVRVMKELQTLQVKIKSLVYFWRSRLYNFCKSK